MDYQQIICKETGKSIKADKIFKVRNNQDCIENIVSICHNCPHCDSKNVKCQNCYGTIVQNSIRQINDETGRIKMDFVNYRNTFIKENENFKQIMDADEFLECIDIVANLNNSNWNHGQRISDHLRSYDRPKTWKTDCANCKVRCKNKGVKPACELAKDYTESQFNNSLENISDTQIANFELPQNCICKEQAPQMYYV